MKAPAQLTICCVWLTGIIRFISFLVASLIMSSTIIQLLIVDQESMSSIDTASKWATLIIGFVVLHETIISGANSIGSYYLDEEEAQKTYRWVNLFQQAYCLILLSFGVSPDDLLMNSLQIYEECVIACLALSVLLPILGLIFQNICSWWLLSSEDNGGLTSMRKVLSSKWKLIANIFCLSLFVISLAIASFSPISNAIKLLEFNSSREAWPKGIWIELAKHLLNALFLITWCLAVIVKISYDWIRKKRVFENIVLDSKVNAILLTASCLVSYLAFEPSGSKEIILYASCIATTALFIMRAIVFLCFHWIDFRKQFNFKKLLSKAAFASLRILPLLSVCLVATGAGLALYASLSDAKWLEVKKDLNMPIVKELKASMEDLSTKLEVVRNEITHFADKLFDYLEYFPPFLAMKTFYYMDDNLKCDTLTTTAVLSISFVPGVSGLTDILRAISRVNSAASTLLKPIKTIGRYMLKVKSIVIKWKTYSSLLIFKTALDINPLIIAPVVAMIVIGLLLVFNRQQIEKNISHRFILFVVMLACIIKAGIMCLFEWLLGDFVLTAINRPPFTSMFTFDVQWREAWRCAFTAQVLCASACLLVFLWDIIASRIASPEKRPDYIPSPEAAKVTASPEGTSNSSNTTEKRQTKKNIISFNFRTIKIKGFIDGNSLKWLLCLIILSWAAALSFQSIEKEWIIIKSKDNSTITEFSVIPDFAQDGDLFMNVVPDAIKENTCFLLVAKLIPGLKINMTEIITAVIPDLGLVKGLIDKVKEPFEGIKNTFIEIKKAIAELKSFPLTTFTKVMFLAPIFGLTLLVALGFLASLFLGYETDAYPKVVFSGVILAYSSFGMLHSLIEILQRLLQGVPFTSMFVEYGPGIELIMKSLILASTALVVIVIDFAAQPVINQEEYQK